MPEQLDVHEIVASRLMWIRDGMDLLCELLLDSHHGHRPRCSTSQRGDRLRDLGCHDLDWLLAFADSGVTYRSRYLASPQLIPVLRRRAPQLTDDVIDVGGLKLDPVTHRLSGNSQSLQIGPTEFRLLHFFMTHPERVFSRSQLLDQVWGDHVFVEERTVDVHIRRLRKALEPSGHDAHVETVRGSGYLLAASVAASH